MNHDEHGGHGAEMATDLLRRFVLSLVLTIPVVLFSPIGEIFGFTAMPPFGLSMAWFGLILATPVVWWGGWPFISAAWRALKRAEANMMTLIATGILVSWLFSVVVTLFLGGGEVFFEAAAMLTSLSHKNRSSTGRHHRLIIPGRIGCPDKEPSCLKNSNCPPFPIHRLQGGCMSCACGMSPASRQAARPGERPCVRERWASGSTLPALTTALTICTANLPAVIACDSRMGSISTVRPWADG
ncbi:hypothetical protein [Deinococcus aquatilis]|uniref:hypothetical protein n=1 Tax=Deinococcus aquatilis TaxID=519440 RepID=UPI001FE054E1|nr:hypothetical protein [Deinococcus aquatilis]